MPEEPSRQGSIDVSRLLVPILLSLCFTKLCLLLLMAVNSRYAMDEYIQAGYSRYIGDGFYQQFDPVKTVLYAYFFDLAHRVGDNSVELMQVARLQGFTLALGMSILTFAVTRRLGASRTAALFATFVLLSFSTFMERGFRVRADTLAAFLALAGLWVGLGGPRGAQGAGHLFERLRPLLAGLLVGAAFLSTQKASYYAVALGLGYLTVAIWSLWRAAGPPPGLRDGLRGLLPAALFSGGWAISVLAYAVFFGGAGFVRILAVVFTAPMQVALHGDEAYSDLWVFLYQTLSRNQLPYGLCFAGIVLALLRFRRLGPRKIFAVVVALVLTIFVMLHNQPWPYVFVLLLPFLAPWSVEVVDWLAPEAPPGSRPEGGLGSRHRGAVLLFFTAALMLSFPRNSLFLRQDNSLQDQVVAMAEALLDRGDSYADGIGMIPTRHRAGERWWWDAATQIEIRKAARRGDFTALEETFGDQPKLWIVNYRILALEPLLRPSLDASYVPVDPNILLAGARLVPGEAQELRAVWPGLYRLYGTDGKPTDLPFQLDGREVRGEVEIAAGPHRLEWTDSRVSEAFLLPSGLTLPGPLPAVGSPRPLFANVYD